MADRSVGTGGGGYVEGDVSAGADAVSRDKVEGDQVSQSVSISLPERMTQDEKLNLLVDRLLGNKWRGTVGLVDVVEEMQASLKALQVSQGDDHRRQAVLGQSLQEQRERNDSRFSTLSMWVWLTLAVAGLEGVVLLVMLMLRI